MKDRIKGGQFISENGWRIIFVKPVKDGYEITENGISGVLKLKANEISKFLEINYFHKVY